MWQTVTVVMMGEMSVDDWNKESGKNIDKQYEVDGMKQEIVIF